MLTAQRENILSPTLWHATRIEINFLTNYWHINHVLRFLLPEVVSIRCHC